MSINERANGSNEVKVVPGGKKVRSCQFLQQLARQGREKDRPEFRTVAAVKFFLFFIAVGKRIKRRKRDNEQTAAEEVKSEMEAV